MYCLRIKSGLILLLPMLATACAAGNLSTLKDRPLAPAATSSSITLEELEPGVCNPVMFEKKRSDAYTGAGYINTPNDIAARVNWSIRSPAGGKHLVAIRFANGSATARPGKLFANDQPGEGIDAPLPPTGAFTQLETANFTVDLMPGQNSLVLRATSAGGLPNIDSLTVTGPNPSPGDCGNPEFSAASDGPVDFSYLNVPPIGWATQGNGVTGGGTMQPIVVSTISALQSHAEGTQPKVIHVKGKLKGLLRVGSNKTIIGMQGAEISSDAGVLRLTDSRNVIIKNLRLVGVHEPNQPNTILHNAQNVWLDHNSFVNGRPDLLLLSGTSDLVTISWNVFRHALFGHEHAGVNIGASDNAPESVGRLRVTLHHNLFAHLVNERMPRVRFGKVHSFNNVADAGTDVLTRSYYAVRPGVDANVRSERNIYKNFNGQHWWWTSEKLGAPTATVFNYARGNENSVLESVEDLCTPSCLTGPISIKEHEGVSGKGGFYSVGKSFIPPYPYVADLTKDLEIRVRAAAGAR